MHAYIIHMLPERFLQERLRVCPCSPDRPWRLVVYSDEVVPGNALSADNRRKMWVIYISFVELGPAALSREDSWFCVTAKRSSEVAKVAGGISQVFSGVLRFMFGESGFNIKTAGIYLPLGGAIGGTRLFAELGVILQDGGAHKLVWHCKGDAGTRFCMLCRNLVSLESDLVAEDSTKLLACSVIHEADLDFATDSDIRGTVRRLAAHADRETKAEFIMRQQAVGFTHEPYSILLDQALESYVAPATQFSHDWMHAIFVHGVFNTVMYLFLEGIIADGGKNVYDIVYDYLALWRWPRRIASSNLKDVFGKKRAFNSRRAQSIKCTASEGLSLYPVLAYFVQAVLQPSGRCPDMCKAYLLLADVIDMLTAVPRGTVTPARLRRRVRAFLQGCEAAGWRSCMHPKFHWLVHLPRHLEQHGTLMTCWVHERKHRMVKRYGAEMCNTRDYDRSILSEITCHHLSETTLPGTFSFDVALLEPHPASQRVRGFLKQELLIDQDFVVSAEARVSAFATCAQRDVVLVSVAGCLEAGEVLLHTEVGGIPCSLISFWTLREIDVAKGSAEWLTHASASRFVYTSSILHAAIHMTCRDGVARTLLPCDVR